jgi:adenosylcobinamide amidohydrolase
MVIPPRYGIALLIREGRLVHAVPTRDGRRWDRTLCNVTINAYWRELTDHERETLPVCPKCTNRAEWFDALGAWMNSDRVTN